MPRSLSPSPLENINSGLISYCVLRHFHDAYNKSARNIVRNLFIISHHLSASSPSYCWIYVCVCVCVLFTRNLFMDIREFHLGTAGNRSWWNYVDRVRRRKKMRHLNSLKFYFSNIRAAMEMNCGICLRKGGRSTGQLNIKWLICSLAI